MNRKLLTLAAVAALAGAPLAMAGGESIEIGRRDPSPEPKLLGGARHRGKGRGNPAGSKIILGFFKAKHGYKAENVEQARRWYAGYLEERDAKVRKAERERRIARIQRNHPWLSEWPTVKAEAA